MYRFDMTDYLKICLLFIVHCSFNSQFMYLLFFLSDLFLFLFTIPVSATQSLFGKLGILQRPPERFPKASNQGLVVAVVGKRQIL